jgi:thiosulfate dehydrogenase (quinone) large subunit
MTTKWTKDVVIHILRKGVFTMTSSILTHKVQSIETPFFINFLFNDRRASILWLVVRVWLGWQWFEAGLGKVQNPAWMQTGEALKGFWTRAVQIPAEGRPPIAYDWYRSSIQSMLDSGSYVWFAKFVAVGELLVGIAMIFGFMMFFTAFMAGFMNWNFIMAGSASVNGAWLVLAILLIAAWKISGYLGADYFLLSRLASLWRPNTTKEWLAPLLPQATK